MEKSVASFIHSHSDPAKPLLLGLSGGPDSIALLHILLGCGYRPGIAHVDHSWRQESGDEARRLALLAEKLQLPFHLKTLVPGEMKGNLEAACRQERLSFFRALCEEQGYQAVVLGHQSDDVVETVLKRCFEGAPLPYLAGLKDVAIVEGLKIIRPLLAFPKQHLLNWLKERSVSYFLDSTNLDPVYLRGRFRSDILPYLSHTFGKEIEPALLQLNRESLELKDFFESHLENYLQLIKITPLGVSLDLSNEMPRTKYELKYLIRRFCEKANLTFPRNLIEKAGDLLEANEADKELSANHRVLYIDRRHLFCLWTPLKMPSQRLPLVEGEFLFGTWFVKVERTIAVEEKNFCNWKYFWEGSAEINLPAESCLILAPPELGAPYPGKSPLKKWWTDAKIPAFFRTSIPVVWKEECVMHEFLTGRKNYRLEPGQPVLHIKFRSSL